MKILQNCIKRKKYISHKNVDTNEHKKRKSNAFRGRKLIVLGVFIALPVSLFRKKKKMKFLIFG